MVTLNQNARIVSLPQDFCNAAMATRACVTANYPSTGSVLLKYTLLQVGLNRFVRHSFRNVTQLNCPSDKKLKNSTI
jgi:hypothetical protein